MAVLTSFSLIYIHLQMKIFDLAYQGKIKEKEIRNLIDEISNETYNILNLKSSNHLGDKLLGEQSRLQFMDNSMIVKIPMPQPAQQTINSELSKIPEKQATFFAGLFSLKSQAEAKPLQ